MSTERRILRALFEELACRLPCRECWMEGSKGCPGDGQPKDMAVCRAKLRRLARHNAKR